MSGRSLMRPHRLIARLAGAYAVAYVVWLPLQAGIIRLVSGAAEKILLMIPSPQLITHLTSVGNSVLIHTYLPGAPQPLARLACDDLHVSAVLSLAMACAPPARTWMSRAKLIGIALLLIWAVMVAVCVVQVLIATEQHALSSLSIAIHTVDERSLLDYLLRKSSVVFVYLLPMMIFLAAYVSAWRKQDDGETPEQARSTNVPGCHALRRRDQGWRSAAALAGGLAAVAAMSLVPIEATRDDRIQGLRKVVALNPRSPDAYADLAAELEEAGGVDEALSTYGRALALQPQLPRARIAEGNILFRKGAYSEAAACYRDVLRYQPNNTTALQNLGSTSLNQERFEEARNTYEAVLRLDPNHVAALRNLSQTLIGLKRGCEALVYLERCMSLDVEAASDRTLLEERRVLNGRCGVRGSRDEREEGGGVR